MRAGQVPPYPYFVRRANCHAFSTDSALVSTKGAGRHRRRGQIGRVALCVKRADAGRPRRAMHSW